MFKKISKIALFIIPIAIAVNFVGGQIVMALKIPLYMDAIGTIVGSALLGYWPGIIIAALSLTLNAIAADPSMLLWMAIPVAHAIIVVILAKHGWFRSFWKMIVMGLILAVVGAGIGTIQTWITYGGDFAATTSTIFAISINSLTGVSRILAELIAQLFMEVPDKVIASIISYFIIKSLPVRFLDKLPLGEYFIPDNLKVSAEAKTAKMNS